MKKIFTILTLSALAIVSLLSITRATASVNYAHDGKVTICHATASDSNPYVTESPDIQNDGSLSGGHLNHTGPVYPSANWGDIIPPYSTSTCPNGYKLEGNECTKNNQPDVTPGSFDYTGMNWTTEGQAFWNNDCNSASVTPTLTLTPTPTNEPCDGDCEETPTPTPTITLTPTPTTTTTTNTGGGSDNLGCSTHDCSNQSHPTQAVLGLSTTDSGNNIYQNLIQLFAAAVFAGLGFKLFKRHA